MTENTKLCGSCWTDIPLLAGRCPNCLSEVNPGGGTPGDGTGWFVLIALAAALVYWLDDTWVGTTVGWIRDTLGTVIGFIWGFLMWSWDRLF